MQLLRDCCSVHNNPTFYRPQTKFGKVKFLHVSVCHSVHGGGVWYPSMPCRSPGPHPGGRLRGLATGGGSPGPHTGGGGRGSPGPHPGRRLRGLATGGVSRPTHRWGCIPACTGGRPPPADVYCCGRYASYRNAFFLRFIYIRVKVKAKAPSFQMDSWIMLLFTLESDKDQGKNYFRFRSNIMKP